MARITEYPQATRFDSGDVIIKDGTNGTKKMTFNDLAVELAGSISPAMHRNIYRGKNLGSGTTVDDVLTSAQKTAISSGTFDDLFIGDYMTLGGIRYDIADMDYWYNIGDTSFTKHHIVMIPHATLYTANMNDTNTTEGAYLGSKMYTDNLNNAKATIGSAFGNMLLSHRSYLENVVTDEAATGGAWVDSTVDLMSEIMVYGTKIRSRSVDTVSDKTQLAIFRLSPTALNSRTTYWLRDVVSATHVAYVSYNGRASANNASSSSGVRPAFPVGVN